GGAGGRPGRGTALMRSLEVLYHFKAPASPAPPDTAPHSSPSATGGAGPASPDSEKPQQSEDHRVPAARHSPPAAPFRATLACVLTLVAVVRLCDGVAGDVMRPPCDPSDRRDVG